MPLNKYLSARPEEEICRGCKFFPTKLEAVPEKIAEAVAVALEFSEIERGGGCFQYPDALTPAQWACSRALTRGRERAENLKADRDRKDRRRKEKQNG